MIVSNLLELTVLCNYNICIYAVHMMIGMMHAMFVFVDIGFYYYCNGCGGMIL